MAKTKAAPKRAHSPAAPKKKTAKATAAPTKATASKPAASKATKAAASKPSTSKTATSKATKAATTKAASSKASKAASSKASKPAASKPAASKPAEATAVASDATAGGAAFSGFPGALFQFLAELALNNEREWFEPRKDRYQAAVLEPALAFIRAMAPRLRQISSAFVAVDKRVGGSLMRVHRDTRFSKDKTPYKTNVGIQFRHSAGKDVHAPGLYVHLEPGECFLGVGLWHPEPDALAKIRARILEEPDAWQRVRDDPALRASFELRGESLARAPRGVDPTHPHVEDLKRKDFIAVGSVPVATLMGKGAIDEVTRRFVAGRDFLRFLCEAVDVAF